MRNNRFNFDDEVLTAFGGDGGGGGGSCGPSSCSSGAGSSGGGSSSSASMCTSASVGGQSITSCISSNGNTTVTTCVGTPGPFAAQLCLTTEAPSITSEGRSKAETNWANSNEFSGAMSSGASSISLAAPIAVRPSVFSRRRRGRKVICTELYRNGHIDHKVWAADIQYSRKNFSEQTMRGYHYWGIPFVRLMQKSKLISNLVKHPTRWFAEDIAYRMGVLSKPNHKGWIIRVLIFRPACYVIGFFAEQKDWKSLWNTQITRI